jgi:NAD(P) transhydrogenase subunit alpha
LVTGYDVRAAARADIASTGAVVLAVGGPAAEGTGGYARELSDAEARAQHGALETAIAGFDVVITTGQVPGRRPPRLVTASALAGMRPGSVVVDLAASPLGGNVDGSAPGETVVTGRGVTVVGAGNLPSAVPGAASTAYSRNVVAVLTHLVRDGALTFDPADEIDAGVVVTHDGHVVHPQVRQLLEEARS